MGRTIRTYKDCPFCGKDAAMLQCRYSIVRPDYKVYYVKCMNCHIRTTNYFEAAEAIHEWNNRKENS